MVDGGLGPIGQIALHVSDVEQSVEFYGGKLGMSQIFAAPELAFFDNGGTRLMLSSHETQDVPSNGRSVIYYTVDDVQSAHEQFVMAGVEFQDEPHIVHSTDNYELWMAFFRDPDGNQLAIMAEHGELS